MAGGPVRRSDGGVIGSAAVDFVRQFKVDYAVIGTSAIDEDGALLDFDYREVRVARAIIENARQRRPRRRQLEARAQRARAHRPSQRGRHLRYGRVALGSVAGGLRRARREGGRGRRERSEADCAEPTSSSRLRGSQAERSALAVPILGSRSARPRMEVRRPKLSSFVFASCFVFAFTYGRNHKKSEEMRRRRERRREDRLAPARSRAFDLAIIGGGINGCGIARDAAGRGASVVLFERTISPAAPLPRRPS